ncbi:Transposase [Geobacillus sp. WSUCF1]|nr:Transposase [Geobacillus sp. WSUCF1]
MRSMSAGNIEGKRCLKNNGTPFFYSIIVKRRRNVRNPVEIYRKSHLKTYGFNRGMKAGIARQSLKRMASSHHFSLSVWNLKRKGGEAMPTITLRLERHNLTKVAKFVHAIKTLPKNITRANER